jgi:hypothetical protein
MLVQVQLLFTFISLLMIPVLIILPLFLLKQNREIYLDATAVFFLWHLGYQKLRCWYWHCCFGLPWAQGVHNRFIDTHVFPMQTLEFAVSMLLTGLCVLFITRSRFYKPGRGLSVALVSYALPRFFWEFLRYRGETYRVIAVDGFIFGLTIEQVVCIIAVLLAVAWWIALPVATKVMDWMSKHLRRALRIARLEQEHTS